MTTTRSASSAPECSNDLEFRSVTFPTMSLYFWTIFRTFTLSAFDFSTAWKKTTGSCDVPRWLGCVGFIPRARVRLKCSNDELLDLVVRNRSENRDLVRLPRRRRARDVGAARPRRKVLGLRSALVAC